MKKRWEYILSSLICLIIIGVCGSWAHFVEQLHMAQPINEFTSPAKTKLSL